MSHGAFGRDEKGERHHELEGALVKMLELHSIARQHLSWTSPRGCNTNVSLGLATGGSKLSRASGSCNTDGALQCATSNVIAAQSEVCL